MFAYMLYKYFVWRDAVLHFHLETYIEDVVIVELAVYAMIFCHFFIV